MMCGQVVVKDQDDNKLHQISKVSLCLIYIFNGFLTADCIQTTDLFQIRFWGGRDQFLFGLVQLFQSLFHD